MNSSRTQNCLHHARPSFAAACHAPVKRPLCGSWAWRVSLSGACALLLVMVTATAPAQQQVWLVSTRGVDSCDAGGDRIDYWRYEDDCRWAVSDRQSLLASDDAAIPTTVFVHGNRTGFDRSVEMGWLLYQELQSHAGGRAFRLIIWSWPSDRVRGFRRDGQVKAVRSDVEGFHIAELLRDMKSSVPVNLLGYSFGARSVTGALELAAGGAVGGRQLPQALPRRAGRVQSILVAAAMDADWILPGHCHGQSLQMADRTLVVHNACDRVLKYYSMMYYLHGPQSLGHVGVPCLPIPDEQRPTVETLDVGGIIGREHVWEHYLQWTGLAAHIWSSPVEELKPNPAAAPQASAAADATAEEAAPAT